MIEDYPDQKRSSCGTTQMEDLPSCLIMDIISRLPTASLLSCRIVCKSWYLFFSDPWFVKLHRARSPTYLIHQTSRNHCSPNLVAGDLSDEFTCVNSSNGLLCLQNCKSGSDEIYVCNPILGEYITIPTTETEEGCCVKKSVLGFSLRSNFFKVLKIISLDKIPGYRAEIYTIGDGTRRWRSVGIAPSCPAFYGDGSVNSFLNGSIHWPDVEARQIAYFNFDSEQFGYLPPLPPSANIRWNGVWKGGGIPPMKIGVLHGCLCVFRGFLLYQPRQLESWLKTVELWIMKEYGVEESWTKIYPDQDFSLIYKNCGRIQLGVHAATYNPSFISLQDIAKGEQFSTLSRTRYPIRTRSMMGCCSQRLSDYLRSKHSGVACWQVLSDYRILKKPCPFQADNERKNEEEPVMRRRRKRSEA